MKELLESRIGKEIELSFGAGAVGGKIVRIDNDILCLEKDDQAFFVRIEKSSRFGMPKKKTKRKESLLVLFPPNLNEPNFLIQSRITA